MLSSESAYIGHVVEPQSQFLVVIVKWLGWEDDVILQEKSGQEKCWGDHKERKR